MYGIIGWPVKHSRSPAMHTAAFGALGIDATYVPFSVAPDLLGQAITGVRALGIAGLNITVPHKETVMAHLDAVDADARTIGAVNTVVRSEGRLVGTNTDAPGFVRSLEEAGIEVAGTTATILGAGGSARACAVGLARAGARRVVVMARRIESAQQLCRALRNAIQPTRLEAAQLGTGENMREVFGATYLLVQATSATLAGSPDADAFADSLPLGTLPQECTVVDLVYNPLETSVLRLAKKHSLRVIDGLGMLAHQGGLAFQRWTGHQAPIERMKQAISA